MSKRTELDIIIAEAGDAPVTAEAIVENARNAARFPALNEYLWRVPVAKLAAEARVQRAHKLLISIRLVTEAGITTRMLMHTTGVRGYQTTDHIVATPDLAKIKLAQLSADIGRARQRLQAFRSFIPDDVANDIDDALRRAEDRARPAAAMRAAV